MGIYQEEQMSLIIKSKWINILYVEISLLIDVFFKYNSFIVIYLPPISLPFTLSLNACARVSVDANTTCPNPRCFLFILY